MKTELEKLIEQHPNLEYEDGYFYKDSEDDGYLTDADGKSLDAVGLINDYFDGYSITLPNNGDPREDIREEVSGWEYVRHTFEEDYNKAWEAIKPIKK